jgi:hypothetical protein
MPSACALRMQGGGPRPARAAPPPRLSPGPRTPAPRQRGRRRVVAARGRGGAGGGCRAAAARACRPRSQSAPSPRPRAGPRARAARPLARRRRARAQCGHAGTRGCGGAREREARGGCEFGAGVALRCMGRARGAHGARGGRPGAGCVCAAARRPPVRPLRGTRGWGWESRAGRGGAGQGAWRCARHRCAARAAVRPPEAPAAARTRESPATRLFNRLGVGVTRESPARARPPCLAYSGAPAGDGAAGGAQVRPGRAGQGWGAAPLSRAGRPRAAEAHRARRGRRTHHRRAVPPPPGRAREPRRSRPTHAAPAPVRARAAPPRAAASPCSRLPAPASRRRGRRASRWCWRAPTASRSWPTSCSTLRRSASSRRSRARPASCRRSRPLWPRCGTPSARGGGACRSGGTPTHPGGGGGGAAPALPHDPFPSPPPTRCQDVVMSGLLWTFTCLAPPHARVTLVACIRVSRCAPTTRDGGGAAGPGVGHARRQ